MIVLLVLLTGMAELNEIPVPIGTVGPTETVLVVPLPYGAPLLVLDETPPEGPVPIGIVGPIIDVLLYTTVLVLLTKIVDVDEPTVLVLFKEATVLETVLDESSEVIGTVGPAETVLLVPFP